MSIRRLAKVNCCEVCPHCRWVKGEGYASVTVCTHAAFDEMERRLVDRRVIPGWCPLPSEKEHADRVDGLTAALGDLIEAVIDATAKPERPDSLTQALERARDVGWGAIP